MPTHTTIESLDTALESMQRLELELELMRQLDRALEMALEMALEKRLGASSAAARLRALAIEHPDIERFVRHCEDNGVLAELEAREGIDETP